MPLVKNLALPNYLISCSSKRARQRLTNFDSISSIASSKPGSGASSSASSRCSSQSDLETKPVISKFRALCSQGFFPFAVDYSVEPHPITKRVQVAWKEPIQSVNVDFFLEHLVEGYEDSNPKYHRVVDAALFDLLRHASLSQLYQLGVILRQPLKRLFMSKNKETVLSALQALEQMLRVVQRAAAIKPNQLRSLLIPINNYYLQCHNTIDMEALYKKRKGLFEIVDTAISIIEAHASDMRQRWRYMRTVQSVYKGYTSRLIPPKSSAINLHKRNQKQNNIQKCLLLRQHNNPYGWRQLHRFGITPDCRSVLKAMPWIVPKGSNFHFTSDDVRVVDMNLS